VKVTPDAARRFLVARHFLAPPRSLGGGQDAVLEVIQKLGSISSAFWACSSAWSYLCA